MPQSEPQHQQHWQPLPAKHKCVNATAHAAMLTPHSAACCWHSCQVSLVDSKRAAFPQVTPCRLACPQRPCRCCLPGSMPLKRLRCTSPLPRSCPGWQLLLAVPAGREIMLAGRSGATDGDGLFMGVVALQGPSPALCMLQAQAWQPCWRMHDRLWPLLPLHSTLCQRLHARLHGHLMKGCPRPQCNIHGPQHCWQTGLVECGLSTEAELPRCSCRQSGPGKQPSERAFGDQVDEHVALTTQLPQLVLLHNPNTSALAQHQGGRCSDTRQPHRSPRPSTQQGPAKHLLAKHILGKL